MTSPYGVRGQLSKPTKLATPLLPGPHREARNGHIRATMEQPCSLGVSTHTTPTVNPQALTRAQTAVSGRVSIPSAPVPPLPPRERGWPHHVFRAGHCSVYCAPCHHACREVVTVHQRHQTLDNSQALGMPAL